ncbi:MAG: hypothetical protein HQL78_06390 [Magnetococcales bacterium]|nr:hypothetical protein [Magnetococcales bacterium]
MIPPRFGRHMAFVRGILALYLIFLVIFFASAPFLTLWLYSAASLSLSLLPQLIGFCLQGAFLVVVFAIYEKRSTIQAMRGHKFALRSAIASLIRPLVVVESVTTKGVLSLPHALARTEQDLLERGISEQMAKKISENANMAIVSFEAMSVLAAQIDMDHLETWGLIINNLRRIGAVQSPGELQQPLLELLRTVRIFDELYIY